MQVTKIDDGTQITYIDVFKSMQVVTQDLESQHTGLVCVDHSFCIPTCITFII